MPYDSPFSASRSSDWDISAHDTPSTKRRAPANIREWQPTSHGLRRLRPAWQTRRANCVASNRRAGTRGKVPSCPRLDRDRPSSFRGRHRVHRERICGLRAAFRTVGFFRRSAPRCSLPLHCCHRRRRARLAKARSSSAGDLDGPSFAAEISVTHVTPAETKVFIVVEVAQRRSPVYWCCQSPQSKEDERPRAPPGPRKAPDTRQPEGGWVHLAVGHTCKVKVKL